MKRLAMVLALLSAAACRSRNPFDTSALESDLAWHEERTLALQQQMVYAGIEQPPEENLGELAPNLDTWRATNVQKADAATLLLMEQVSTARVARLDAQVASLARQPARVVYGEWLAARNDLHLERRKLAIIQLEIRARGASGGR